MNNKDFVIKTIIISTLLIQLCWIFCACVVTWKRRRDVSGTEILKFFSTFGAFVACLIKIRRSYFFSYPDKFDKFHVSFEIFMVGLGLWLEYFIGSMMDNKNSEELLHGIARMFEASCGCLIAMIIHLVWK